MVNYKLGKIYKIVRLTDDCVVYVGSTCETALCRRLVKHKYNATKYLNRKLYKSIDENGGWKNHEIVLIEGCICDSKDELYKKEREFIVSLKPIGNLQIPLRTIKEWKYDNKEKIDKYAKEYRNENKEKLEQKIDCSCGGKYTHQNRSHHFKTKFHINNIPKPDLNSL